MGQDVTRFVVEERGQGLMVPPPVRPAQHAGEEDARAPEQGHEEAAYFGHADADQPTAATGRSFF